MCCKTRLLGRDHSDLIFERPFCSTPLSRAAASTYAHQLLTPPDVYAAHAVVARGGDRQSSFASRLKFCAVAVSSTSSFAPVSPRRRSRSSLWMRFMCANRISTFLRSRRETSKAAVLASART